MKVRTFTLKEANRAVPKIKEHFDDIIVIKKKIAILKAEADWLREFWGKSLHDIDNPDSDKYTEIAEHIEDMYTEIGRKVKKIQNMGCIVKDTETGLVDFYSSMKGELVLLCWKYGEPEIRYWHSLEGGFRGRQSISSTKKIE